MIWFMLFIAVCFEVAGIACMKLSHGFTRIIPSILILVFYAIALILLVEIAKTMSISISYAIWAGAGTALSAIMGMVVFKEKATIHGIVGVLIVAAGIILIKAGS